VRLSEKRLPPQIHGRVEIFAKLKWPAAQQVANGLNWHNIAITPTMPIFEDRRILRVFGERQTDLIEKEWRASGRLMLPLK